ncbi:hypothetical protein conserved [Leishmania donovani]|uniref:Uncharacterized protein n=4 Tax=Leishmania donovani species complex TaxID=38574 RepID=A4I6P1_LEIIN|nr:hypothetical protein, unknown function [Leishmania infantum JPCM5]XP_003863208.1 hypothetical protein, unknown function [Leishmania donovani]CAC9518747.1 hypothetical_protein_-_conserved [Leishmania infantum]CAJ1991306.1 hypothetical protein conserved [Leishmania donovani]CAM70468.1 hypothetical protein, unknown function [Leishmania infantum JPCM5]CBZ36519.1 hypothetical protein, unknown function [Leishmania donovani]SUZ44330.1 hypothetical_protein_-_conserved [Leishmania infantum]|eukprot:XP_001467410.1 hypothetical protein, unknown function [Leishmania infantum JPCM5]
MAKGSAGMSAAATSAVGVGGSRRSIEQLSRAAVTDMLQYTPHIPSICCAAAHPYLRYAREAVAGTRVAEGSAHHRSDLYVCWDWTTNYEYHSLSGAEEELEADLRQLGWWLTRPFTEDGKPMTMEVNVKREASYHPPLPSTPSATATATKAPPAGFESILRILTQPPFQRTDVGISCLRSLIVTPNRKEVSKTAIELIGQLTHLEKLESFTQFLALPLPSLTSVSVLRLHNVRALTSLEPLVPLSGLKRISLCRCASLHSLAALSQLRELNELRLSDCRVLDARGNYSACRRLTSVSMRWCGAVLHVGDLATLPNLRDLDCSYSGVRDLESLKQCLQLRRLCLRGCHSIHELFHAMDTSAALLKPPGGVAATEISRAFLDRVAAPAIVDEHVSLSAANKLTLTGDASTPPAGTVLYPVLSITMPSPASSFSQLEELDVGESSLVSLSGLPQCAPELRHLTVRECQQLHSLSPLGELLKLTSVDASFSGVDDLEGLSESVSLQYVNLRNCVRLRTAASLARVRSLREIDLSAANQNCIICVCNRELDTRNESTGGHCVRRRRSEPLRQRLLMLSGPVGGVGDMHIDTAVTQRSSLRLLQHRVLRQEAEALLRQPLEQVLATEARPQEAMW